MPVRKKKHSPSRKRQKTMAEKTLISKESNGNRNAKDSVFCDLFGKPEYLIQLYTLISCMPYLKLSNREAQ